MRPRLGSQKPETRHLNLKWSIADIDRVLEMARNHQTAHEISHWLKGTRLESEPEEIADICFKLRQFVRIGA